MSKACVNCRRRKVGFGRTLVFRSATDGVNDECRSDVQARSHSADTALHTTSSVVIRSWLNDKGATCVAEQLAYQFQLTFSGQHMRISNDYKKSFAS